jgi:hypothetical protein
MVNTLDGDRFIANQLRGVLDRGEVIEHTAYLESPSGTSPSGSGKGISAAYWAALTPRRLLLIQAPVGAFKPILENKGVVIIDRASIAGANALGALTLVLTDGRRFDFYAQRASKHASGQAGLIDELIERHGGGAVSEGIAKEARSRRVVGLATIVLVAGFFGFFGYQVLYGSRAEVSVDCGSGSAGIQCTATHTAGGAKAKACWYVRMRCQNKLNAVAHACAEVEPSQTQTVTVAEQEFDGLASCDARVGLEVDNITVR